jgi:hypothetical protein
MAQGSQIKLSKDYGTLDNKESQIKDYHELFKKSIIFIKAFT